MFCSAEFKARHMTKISACVGVGIYSLRLHFNDGTASPIIGSRSDMTTEVHLNLDPITSIGIRAWKENYVQTVKVE